ncbi:MAG: AI-2E family transporter [Nitrospira sp.]|nr:AI-2E family transporter [Nitrospira sp.]
MPDRRAVDRHLWEIVAVRDLFWILGILLFGWIGYVLQSILTPILLGLGFAYLFNPLITHMHRRWGVPRLLTISLLIVLLVLLLGATLVWIGPIFSNQLMALIDKIPHYVTTLATHYKVDLGSLFPQMADVTVTIKKDPMSILGPLFTGTGQAFGLLGTVIGSTLNVTLVLVLVPIFFILFALDFESLTSRMMMFIPLASRPRVTNMLERMDHAVSGFFRGRLLVGLITAAMYSFGWALADVPYWSLLGIATGVLTIIPYASAVGWPLAVMLKYLDVLASPDSGSGWLAIVVWPSVTYLAVQFVESWILTPWIQSQSLDLSATTVMIVVLIGGAVGGFFGLLLAIPITVCMKILLEEYVLSH